MTWVSEAKMGLIRNWSMSPLMTEDERTAYETVLALLDPESYPTNDRKEMDAESERHSRGGDDARGNPGPPRGAVLPTDFSSWDRDRRQDWLMSIGLDDVIADEAEMDRRIIDYLEDNRG